MSTQDGGYREYSSPRRDQAELVALVVRSRRQGMMRAHHRRLRREDLEDCFGQAALELVARARHGTPFLSFEHAANALEQRFLSRIHDRRRAIEGRSEAQAAFENALRAGFSEGVEVRDPRADVERIMLDRLELGRVETLAARLTPDQRLVLAHQIAMQAGCAEFCARFGWSHEKYRKVAQRGRARLRALRDAADAGRLDAAGGDPGAAGRRSTER